MQAWFPEAAFGISPVCGGLAACNWFLGERDRVAEALQGVLPMVESLDGFCSQVAGPCGTGA